MAVGRSPPPFSWARDRLLLVGQAALVEAATLVVRSEKMIDGVHVYVNLGRRQGHG